MSVISSIPKEWKIQLKSEQIHNQRQETLLSKLLKSKQANTFLYEYQLAKSEKILVKPEQK